MRESDNDKCSATVKKICRLTPDIICGRFATKPKKCDRFTDRLQKIRLGGGLGVYSRGSKNEEETRD